MAECKRCGSEKTVKSGMVRGKQRYLCKQCGYHFVELDQREKSETAVLKALCTLFQALGTKRCSTISEYLRRDTALIHRWMNKEPSDFNRRWKTEASEFVNTRVLFNKLREHDLANGRSMLLVDNIVDGLYIAVIVQRRYKR